MKISSDCLRLPGGRQNHNRRVQKWIETFADSESLAIVVFDLTGGSTVGASSRSAVGGAVSKVGQENAL